MRQTKSSLHRINFYNYEIERFKSKKKSKYDFVFFGGIYKAGPTRSSENGMWTLQVVLIPSPSQGGKNVRNWIKPCWFNDFFWQESVFG